MKTTVSVIIRIFLWFVMLVGGAVYSIMQDMDKPIFHNVYFHIISFLIGFIIIIFSFRAAANGGRELSKGRIGDIPRLETNKLVTSGIYTCMRHPMLFGLTLLPLGVAFLVGSVTFIKIVAPLEMIFIVIMVLVFEEREVDKKFGKDYQRYKKTVPLVSFKWVCLKKLFAKNKPKLD